MKKITKTLVLATAAVALAFGVKPAQAQSTTSGNTIVTVTVVDVLLLAVAVPAIPLKLATTDDYTKGTSFVAPAQLTASSNHNYDIKVIAATDLQGQLTAAGSSIGINNVSVQTAPNLSTTYSDPKPLSLSNQTLIGDAPPAMLKIYDVKYSIAANDLASFLNVKQGAYTSTLTYSIVAK